MVGFAFFIVPIQDDGEAADRLNAFVSSHKVISVKRRWVPQGSQSFWAFCVDFVTGGKAAKNEGSTYAKERIDYREKLNPEKAWQSFAIGI